MNNMKRIISMLLAFTMLFSLTTIMVSADETTTTNDEAADAIITSGAASALASLPNDDVKFAADYRFDYSLGLFELLEDGYWQNQQVTRAEFATVVAKMMKANTDGYPRYGQSPYLDIDASSFAYPAVCYLTEIGMLNGDGNSEYRPNDPILVNEASKMIMIALGYKPACEITNGGYPNGYTTFALRQGIYNGLSLSYTNSMTALEMSKMVRNAMEAYLMETLVYRPDGSSDVTVSDSKTLLTETYKVITETGFVESTYFSYLAGSEVDLENEVIISGVAYQFANDFDMEALVGYEVNYYYMEDVSGYRRSYISYCEPRKDKNKEYNVSARNIQSLTSDKLVYTDVNDRERTFTIDSNTLISYNGKPYYELSDESLIIKEGYVKVLTHESSTKASAVMIQEQFDGLFDRYNKTTQQVVFQENMTNILPQIKFDSAYHTRLTLDGKTIAPEDLIKNDVITFSVSKDGEFIRGYVSRTEISGTITKVRTEEYPAGDFQIVAINGDEYFVSPYCTKELTSGFISDFQITYDGRILGTNVSTANGGNYAYLIKFAAEDSAFASSFKVKVLTRNGEIREYTSATKINTNIENEEMQRSASEIIASRAFDDPQLVVFDVNSEGKIRSLYRAANFVNDLSDPDDLDFGLYFEGESRYRDGLIASCAVSDSTLIFRVPSVDRDRNEDYKIQTKNDLANGGYQVQIYDIRKGVANVMVITDNDPTRISNSAGILIVDKFSTAWDEEKQDKVLEIDGWQDQEIISLKIDEDCSQGPSLTTIENKDIKELRRGDVIQYELGANGYMHSYRVLFNYDLRVDDRNYFEINQDKQEDNYKISNDELYTLFGEVIRVYDFYIVESTKLADKKYFRPYATNDINLYIYDTEKNEIILGEPFDIERGNQVFIRTKNIDQQVDMLVIQ